MLPWVVSGGMVAIAVSTFLTVVSGLGVGIYIGYSSGRYPIWSGIRQMLIVAGSALFTYAVGFLFGMGAG